MLTLPYTVESEGSPACTPFTIANGNYSMSNKISTDGTVVTVSCNSGYKLLGSATVTCKMDKSGTLMWSGPLPSCVGK